MAQIAHRQPLVLKTCEKIAMAGFESLTQVLINVIKGV